jgi:hypothetical protein
VAREEDQSGVLLARRAARLGQRDEFVVAEEPLLAPSRPRCL